MATIFERIVDGEIPCHKIWEDDDHLAFLDINPRVEGHTLVIPKKPWNEVFAMTEDDVRRCGRPPGLVARHLEERTGCERVVVVVLGYEVPHVHIHLMPTNRLEDFPFPPVDEDAKACLVETAERLAGDVRERLAELDRWSTGGENSRRAGVAEWQTQRTQNPRPSGCEGSNPSSGTRLRSRPKARTKPVTA